MKFWLKRLLMLPALWSMGIFGIDDLLLAALITSVTTVGTQARNEYLADKEGPPTPGYRPSQFSPRPQEPQRRPIRGYEGGNLMNILSLMGRR